MARLTKGRLYKRGKCGVYYLQYYINGQQFRVALKDKTGDSITTEPEAMAAAERLLKPITAKNKAEQLNNILDAVSTAEMKLNEAEKEAEAHTKAQAEAIADKKALKIADAWKKYTDPDERLKPECSARNLANYRGYWKRFGEWLAAQSETPVYMRDVTPALAKRFANYLESENASGNTFNKYRAFLFSFFEVLTPFIRGSENPFATIKRKEKVKAVKRRDLTLDELQAILSNATGELGLLLWVGITTGLRLGDAVTLEWGAVNLNRGIITNSNRKTGATVTIGIVKILAGMLEQMPPDQRHGYLMPKLAAEYLNPNTQTHFVARLQRYFESCGIQTHKTGTGKGTGKRAVTEVGFHSLRHSFATICGEVGTAESVTQKLLGHSRAAMTHYYQHDTEAAATDTAKRLDGALRGLLPTAAAIDVIAVEIEPERAELHRLADTLNIEQIKQLLTYNNLRRGKDE